MLTYSAEDYANDSYNGPMLNWARRYVREHIDDLRSKCGDGTAIPRIVSGAFVDDRAEVYLGFFYSKDVPGPAERDADTARGCTDVHRQHNRNPC